MTSSRLLVRTLIATTLLPAMLAAQQATNPPAAAPDQTATAGVATGEPAGSVPAPGRGLQATNHPVLPAKLSEYWLVPTVDDARAAKSGTMPQFAEAVKLEVDGNFAKALPILAQPSMQQGPLGHYAQYYQGLAELRLGRPGDANQTFEALTAKQPVGYLVEGLTLRHAEAEEALGNLDTAIDIYDRLSKTKTTAPDDILMRLAHTARSAGRVDKAVEAYSRVIYEFPFSDASLAAATELDGLPVPALTGGSPRYKLELGRAERLFGAKRYTAARPIFERLRRDAAPDDREVIDLRLAECDYFMKHARAARDGVRPYIDKASRQGEALYFYAIASRDSGDSGEYLRVIRRVADEFPNQTWSEEALNNLATYYIIQNDDEQADATFREMYEKYPTGHYAERAAWKIGWWAYKNDRYAGTISAFESAATNFPRSDYRPSWLYWSARAHEALKEQPVADARFTLLVTDYLNSYYGRLAAARLRERGLAVPQRRLIVDPATVDEGTLLPYAPPPNSPIVRALLSLGLYDQALDELRFAQKAWGDSSPIQATFGWIYNQRGDLRAGINAMKRAYPQYLAAGGEQIPAPLLRVRFPVNYWPQIQKYSTEHGLDPYMMAALISQESNFTADIKSRANAYGLMQLLPSTGRQYAKTLSPPRRFSLSLLTSADTNLRMGTAYFADLVKQFGSAHYALATYNAGPNRVTRWMSERPGVARDEFIDDIPFPETQDYVKKIIGQAEDYRRVYGPGAPADADLDVVKPAVASGAPASATSQKDTSKSKSSSSKKSSSKSTKKKTPKA
ncbi:MAG TPA: transglycosylase SLT domain-containing protein [Vicinamibacterales bacterium]|jgi:soluble lytic murein transglycosylase